MTPSEHIEAARQAAKVLAQGNLFNPIKAAVIHDWVVHITAFLREGRK